MQENKSINEESQFVVIGKILDVYGLKGELKVLPYLMRKHWLKIKRVFLKRKGGEYVPFWLKGVNLHGGKHLILHFEGCNSIEDAQSYRGAKVFLPRSELPRKGRNEYYYFELEGLKVFTDKGRYLGELTGVVEQKPYDLLEVDRGKLYIPFVKALVKSVQLKEGRLVVDDILSEL